MSDKSVKVSTRLRPAVLAAVESFAEENGMTTYLAISRLIESGLKAEQGNEGSLADRMLDAVVGLADRLDDVEKGLAGLEIVSDRALFASVAAYSYSRAAALFGRDNDEFSQLDRKAREGGKEAYERQMELIEASKRKLKGE